MRIFADVDELRRAAGSRIGTSDWITVDRSTIERFADVTGDHDWIPRDADKATDSRFGTGVAHGFLVLSLLPALVGQVYRIRGVRVNVNYGLNRVRFITPVPVGGRIRAFVDLAEVTDVSTDGDTGGGPGGGPVQLGTGVTVELAGAGKPAMVAEWLIRLYR